MRIWALWWLLPQETRLDKVNGYNGQNYNPNIESQDLIAKYCDTLTESFYSEDSYPRRCTRLIEFEVDVSHKLGINPDDFLSVIAFETEYTFDPAFKTGNATGLIQFMPIIATDMGTTVD